MHPMAKNLLAMRDPFLADDLISDQLLRLSGSLLGYAEMHDDGHWIFEAPRKLPAHLSKVYRVGEGDEEAVEQQEAVRARMMAGSFDIFAGELKDNTGKVVIPKGKAYKQTDVELEGMNYLVEGVVGKA